MSLPWALKDDNHLLCVARPSQRCWSSHGDPCLRSSGTKGSACLLQPWTFRELVLAGHGGYYPCRSEQPPSCLRGGLGEVSIHLWLWFPVFSYFLYPASPGWTGSDNHTHKAEGEGCLPTSPLIFAIHQEQQRGGEGWRKIRFGWAGCSLGCIRMGTAGRGKVRRWCWCEHKCTHSGQ